MVDPSPLGSTHPSAVPDTRHPVAASTLVLVGVRGSRLLVSRDELTVCHCRAVQSGAPPCRSWDLGAIAALGLCDYGPLAAVVATLSTGSALPLLLLDIEHVPSARRAIDLLARQLSQANIMRRTA